MAPSHCERTRQTFREAASGGRLALTHDLVEHVAGCDVCKGALLLLMAELLHARPEVEELDCPACEQQLAAFLELELDEGYAAAVQAYPRVAWHLWTCPDCAELGRLTRALLEAQRGGDLPLPPPLGSERS